jgi:hypothetical protein
MTKNEIEDAKIAVKFGMTEDRQKTIVAAFKLGDDELGAAFLHLRSRLSNLNSSPSNRYLLDRVMKVIQELKRK